jgi:hypothetical protein
METTSRSHENVLTRTAEGLGGAGKGGMKRRTSLFSSSSSSGTGGNSSINRISTNSKQERQQ